MDVRLLDDLLSPYAARYFGTCRRDPYLLADQTSLRLLLGTEQLPLLEQAAAFERLVGGTACGDGYLGTYAFLHEFSESQAQREACRFTELSGHLGVPIGFVGHATFWIDAGGVVYHLDSEVGCCAPVAESFMIWLERWAMDARVSDSAEYCSFFVAQPVGPLVADAVGILFNDKLSDSYASYWNLESERIVEQTDPYTKLRHTKVRLALMDDAVVAICAIASREPSVAVHWYGSMQSAVSSEAPLVARVGWYDARVREPVGELLFLGVPGQFGVRRMYFKRFEHLEQPLFVSKDFSHPDCSVRAPADFARRRP